MQAPVRVRLKKRRDRAYGQKPTVWVARGKAAFQRKGPNRRTPTNTTSRRWPRKRGSAYARIRSSVKARHEEDIGSTQPRMDIFACNERTGRRPQT